MSKPYYNPNCTTKNRCGECSRDKQVEAQIKMNEVRREAAALYDNKKQRCMECDIVKPIELFMGPKSRKFRGRCITCDRHARYIRDLGRVRGDYHNKFQCIDNCGRSVGEKGRRCLTCYKAWRHTAAEVNAKKPAIKSHACLGGCGMSIKSDAKYCQRCKHARQIMIANSAESKVSAARIEKLLSNGKTPGVMRIGNEFLALSSRCSSCNKPVLVPSRCYQCSVGRPATLSVKPQVIYS